MFRTALILLLVSASPAMAEDWYCYVDPSPDEANAWVSPIPNGYALIETDSETYCAFLETENDNTVCMEVMFGDASIIDGPKFSKDGDALKVGDRVFKPCEI